MQLYQFLTANRTQRLPLLNLNLQPAIATNTKPRTHMRTLNISPNSRMIQLIPSSTKNRLTLTHNLHNIPILLKSSHFPTIKTATTAAIPALVIAIPTSISTLDNAQDVKMGTPIPETHIVKTKTVKNQTYINHTALR